MQRIHGIVRRLGRMWSDLPLRRKGLIVVAIPLAALIFTMASSLFAERQQEADEQWVAHSLQVKTSIERVDAALMETELRQRGYLLSGQPGLLALAGQARRRLSTDLDQLHDLVRDNPTQSSTVTGIQSLIAQEGRQTAPLLAGVIALRNKGAQNTVEDHALDRQAVTQSTVLLDDIRPQLDLMRGHEERLLDERLHRLNRVALLSNGISVLGTVLGLLGGVAAMLLFTVGIAGRVGRLEKSAGLLAAGVPLDSHDPSRDELGALARKLEQTSQLLVQREHDLHQAATEADRANQAKSEFLSRMSHELRTPLNAILGFGQLLEMAESTPLQSESVGQILKGGQHLLELINEVLDIARVEAGHVNLSIEAIPFNDVLREALDLVRPLAVQSNIQMDAMLPDLDDTHVLADRLRLRQVLINLLSNAVKYNRPAGSVTVSRHETPEGRLRVEVQDTGAGIAPDDVKKLFVPFERLSAENSTVEGTGLGLALSQRLMQAMHGTLGVESVVGQGSTFFVELPLAPAPSPQLGETAQNDAEADAAMPPFAERTVLCIEDNLSNYRLIEAVLEKRTGVRLLGAVQGEMGLEMARQQHPDLILLDLHLPDIRGHEVLSRLKESADTRDIPVVVLSADATAPQIERLLAGGANAYLTKPLNVPQFLRVLDEALLLGEA